MVFCRACEYAMVRAVRALVGYYFVLEFTGRVAVGHN